MWYYIAKRILLFIPTLLGITLITFILMQALPGDPVQGMAGERASAETIERIRAELGQNRPSRNFGDENFGDVVTEMEKCS